MRTPRASAPRRAATLILSLVLALSLCPAAAFADAGDAVGSLELAASSDDIASGMLGTCTWVIDSEGCLTIAPANGTSGSFEFADAGYDSWPWHEYCDDISVVAVESDVKASGSLACMFCGYSSLVSADLSGLDTSSVDNMYQMFYACESLVSLDLSSFDTSNVTNMYMMFYDCASLTSLDLSSFDTSNVTDMFWMFGSCYSLVSLDLSSFDTSNITYMGGMFLACNSLTSLDLSSFDTSNVTSMYAMFYYCYSLTSLDLSSFDTAGVTDMYSMFYGCTALRQVALGDGFSFVETLYDDCGPYLPSPYSSAYGAEGAWRSDSGAVYENPADIPGNTAATYTAVFCVDGEWVTEPGFFYDVANPGEWYYDAIYYLADLGVVTGYTEGEKAGSFGVDDPMERQDFLTMLWRACCPEEYASYGGDYSGVSNGSGLSDVEGGTYYAAAVNWAVEAGISTGYTDGEKAGAFGVGDPVTFEQVVTMVARLANGGELPEGYDASVIDSAPFADGSVVSSWARASMAWAVNEGLVTGYELDDGTRALAPGEDVSRARVATILARYLEMEGEENAATPASDFEYAIGDYCITSYDSLGVRSGDPQDLEYYEKVEGSYEEYLAIDEGPGCYFSSIKTFSGSGVGSSVSAYSGYDCGYGVYITGYKGTDSNVVVPQQIDGVDVVCVAIGQPPEVESIDVSRCTGLKAFEIGRGYISSGSLVEELRTVDFGEGLSLENIHLEAASFADTRGLGSLAQLRSLEIIYTEIASLDVSGLGSLEYLLCANNEKLVDTSDLEAWLEAEGHEGSIVDNGGVYD